MTPKITPYTNATPIYMAKLWKLFGNRIRFTAVMFLLFSLLMVEKGWGQVTVVYSAMTTGSCLSSAPTAATISPAVTGLTFSQFVRGSGVTCVTAGNGMNGSVFNSSSQANAISANQFYTFSITSDASTVYSITGISIQSQKSNVAAVSTAAVQYSINGGSFIDLYTFNPTTSSVGYPFSPSVPLIAGVSQNIVFRVVGWGSDVSTRTFRIENSTSITLIALCASTSNFYSKSTGTLNSTSTWGTNTDGSGTAPTNFTNSCQVFNIRNGNSGTLSSAWAVSGGFSKIVVENTDFTIASTNAATGTIDVNASRTLTLQNATLPALGTLSPTSTVIYNQTGSFTPTANTYGNVILNNTSLTNPGGSIDWTLAGSISLTNGAAFNAGNLGINTTGALDQTISGGNINIRSMDHTLKTNGNFTFGSNSNITITSGSLTGTFTGISNQFIDSGNSITVGNNVTLGGNSSGYNLTGTLILNATSGTAILRGDGSSSTPIAAQLNNLISNVSGSTSTSFRPSSGTNTIIVKGNVSISGVGTGSVFFNQNTISIGGSFFNDRTADNINAGTSTLVFYGTGIHSFVSSVAGGITLYNLLVNKNGTISQNGNLLITSVLGISNGTWDAQTNTLSSSTAILSMTGGALRLAKTGIILPEFSKTGSDAYNITGGIIELYGNGSQTLRGSRDYATLLFTANTVSSVTSAPNSFTGIGIANNAILDIQSFNVGGNFRTLTMTGSSLLRTSGSGTVPPMGDLYTLSPNTTIEIYGTNASTSIRQGPTTGGTQPHKYQSLLFSGTATITGPANTLRVEGNFTNNLSTISGLFLANNGIVSFSGTNQTIGGTNTRTEFANLNFSNTGTKKVLAPFLVRNTLSVSGSNTLVDNVTNAITLISDASNTARIDKIINGCNITGNITMQRYIPAKRDSRFISPAVQGVTAATLKNFIFVTGSGGTVSGFDANFSNRSTVSEYVESTTGIGTFGWKQFSNVNNPLNVGHGYLVFIRGDRTPANLSSTATTTVNFNFTGLPNIGNITVPVSYTNNNVSSADGFNLVGNPYPSQIDWNAASGWTKTNVLPTIYIWDAITSTYFSYNQATNLGSDGRTNPSLIPSSQAFFVTATSSGASLTFTEDVKSNGTPRNNFRTEEPTDFIRIKTQNATNVDYAVIGLHAGATNSYDAYFDAIKMANPGISIASVSSDNVPLSINMIAPKDTIIVPLSLATSIGSHTFSFDGLTSFTSDKKCYLFDKFLENVTEVTNNTVYTFDVTTTPSSFGNARFELNVYEKPQRTENLTSVFEQSKSAQFTFQIQPNPVVDGVLTLTIKNPTLQDFAIQIMNTSGATVFEKSVTGHEVKSSQNVIVNMFDALPAGLYVARITTKSGTQTSKFLNLR